jgi:ATP-dependent DNA helicase RecG
MAARFFLYFFIYGYRGIDLVRAELLGIINKGKNKSVEFKREDAPSKHIAKHVVAMANSGGGRILVGVEDDGVISGIWRPDLEKLIKEKAFSLVYPALQPDYEEIIIDGNKKIAVISIEDGTSKPYALRDKGKSEIYIRDGRTSVVASREQQLRISEAYRDFFSDPEQN